MKYKNSPWKEFSENERKLINYATCVDSNIDFEVGFKINWIGLFPVTEKFKIDLLEERCKQLNLEYRKPTPLSDCKIFEIRDMERFRV